MGTIIWGLAGAGVLVAYGLVRSVYKAVVGFGAVELRPAGALSPDESADVERHDTWAAAHGFERIGVYRAVAPPSPPVLTAAWRFPGVSTFFCLYKRRRVYTDRVTYFSNGTSVTTGDASSAFQLPMRPGSMGQSFPGASLDELWARHLEAEEHFIKRVGLRFAPDGEPFEQRFTKAVREQIAHVRSFLFWPLRVFIWMLLARRRLNRPVTELLPRESAPLARELLARDSR